ncbi:type II secretion system protein [Poriferisphaera sp. WC338]|uniref:type II secretion system protein n=1 Tax=Poriferisphaera sp. WC338 TaxID=3425129 RepID=UPI003D81A312
MESNRRHTCGFTLIETIMSILIVGGLFVAALTVYHGSKIRQIMISEEAISNFLAESLLEEILSQSYSEVNSVGSSAGESVSRIAFDSIDDYAGYVEKPVKTRSGEAIDGYVNWKREVTVTYLNPADIQKSQTKDAGLKKVTVSVFSGQREKASVSTIVSSHYQMLGIQ